MNRRLKYRGDRTAPFDPDAGTGTIGKVVGPSHGGQWLLIVGAIYDVASDTTTVEMAPIPSPESSFYKAVSQ